MKKKKEITLSDYVFNQMKRPSINITTDPMNSEYINFSINDNEDGELKFEYIPFLCEMLLRYYCDHMIEYKLGK